MGVGKVCVVGWGGGRGGGTAKRAGAVQAKVGQKWQVAGGSMGWGGRLGRQAQGGQVKDMGRQAARQAGVGKVAGRYKAEEAVTGTVKACTWQARAAGSQAAQVGKSKKAAGSGWYRYIGAGMVAGIYSMGKVAGRQEVLSSRKWHGIVAGRVAGRKQVV